MKNPIELPKDFRVAFFDMDGVLLDSMHNQTKAWKYAFSTVGLDIPEFEFYMNEGSSALLTSEYLFKKYHTEESTPEIADQLKKTKHKFMEGLPETPIMEHMPELVELLTKRGIECWVVTGSAQDILFQRVIKSYGGNFERSKMVTALDVKNPKPNPEPYLQGIEKSGYAASQAIVIENAPLGVQSAKQANILTLAINSSPIDAKHLSNSGADLVFENSKALLEFFISEQ